MLVFHGGRKTKEPSEKPSSKTRIINKLNPHPRDTRSESNPGHLRFNSFTRMTGQYSMDSDIFPSQVGVDAFQVLGGSRLSPARAFLHNFNSGAYIALRRVKLNNPFSNENGAVLLRIRLSYTLQRRKRSPKTESFKNALHRGAI